MALHVYFMMMTICTLFGTSCQQINTSEPDDMPTCPIGWRRFQNTCYSFVRNLITWEEARSRCADRGAILAEPDTREKYQFLDQTLGAWGWVGATDRQAEGTWVWSHSGRSVDPSLWYPGQPSPTFGEEDCAAMGSIGLRDGKCSWEKVYICEIPAVV